jgi:type I restriction enzyme S subunit
LSKIDDLIAKFCPNGVEFKTVASLFDIANGYTPSKSKSEFWNNGTIPWIRLEDIRANGRILSEGIQKVHSSAVRPSGAFAANSIIISTLATIGEHALVTVPFVANQQTFGIL